MEELLTDLYYNPKTGYSSKDKLYRRAKELDDNITLKIVQEFLDRQPTAQITKQDRERVAPYLKSRTEKLIFHKNIPNFFCGVFFDLFSIVLNFVLTF